MVDPALLASIDELAHQPFSGEAYCHQPPQYSPLSGRGARIVGGRWNPRDSYSVVYLGLDERTIVDEFHRHVRRQARAVDEFLPRTLFRYELTLEDVLDLRALDALEAVGLGLDDVRSDDLSACQSVGEAAHHGGREGVLAPSAAGDGEVLALFVDRLSSGSGLTPLKVAEWTVGADVPTQS